MSLRMRGTAIVLAGLAGAGVGAGEVRAQPPVLEQAADSVSGKTDSGKAIAFDIAPGPLGPALQHWARTSGSKLLVSSHAIRNMTTPGLRGNFTPAAALERLLHGNNLVYVFKGKHSATIFGPDGALEARAQATALPQIEVATDTAPPERGNGPVQGFVAHKSLSGTKTDTPLLETPQAISVVGRDQVVNQGSQSVVEALRYTAGVSTNINPNDNRFESLRIRGFEPVLYLDGMQLPFGSLLFGRPKVDPFMLERIEVLKGPSSSLYGQVAPGGLVNLVSKLPSPIQTRAVEIQANNFGQIQAGFDVGGPASKDGDLLYRLTGVVHDGGTQIDHVDDFRGAIAPSFTWRPNLDTTLTVLGSYQRDNSGVSIQFLPSQGTLLPNPNGIVPVSRFTGEPGFNKFERTQYWAGYQFEHRASDVWTLRQNLRYASLDTTVKAVLGAGLQPDLQTLRRSAFIVPEKADAFTVDNQAEARFSTGPLAHTALFGFDYRRVTSDSSQYFAVAPTINLFNPVYGAAVPAPALVSSISQRQNQLGAYVQDQVAFDRWRLTLNGRHDWISTETDNHIAATRQAQSDTAFSGRAGLTYVFDFGVAPYVAVARSFQPTLGAAGGVPFKPTTGIQQEVGIKYQPANLNLLLTGALFNLVQQNVVTPSGLLQVQTGEVRSRGAELEAAASLSNGLRLVASYTYTDTEVTSTGIPAQLGKRFITVPLHQGAIWADYTFQSGALAGFGFGAGVRYVGQSYGDAANTVVIPNYSLIDATAHYDLSNLDSRLKGAKLALNVNNLFDKRYVSTCASLNQCYYGTGRVITGSLRYTW